jgi:hypothetical protein
METESSLSCSQEPSVIPILSQMNPVYNPIMCFMKIHFMLSFPKATRGLERNSYREALLITLLHAFEYVFKQFAEYTSTDWK